MGTYRQPDIIVQKGMQSFSSKMNESLSNMYTQMAAANVAKRKRNQELINEAATQHDVFLDNAKNIDYTGMTEFDNNGKQLVSEWSDVHYGKSLSLSKGEFGEDESYSTVKTDLANIESIPKNYAEGIGAWKSLYDRVDQALNAGVNNPGYIDERLMDQDLLAMYYEFKNNQGKNIVQTADANGNVFFTLPGGAMDGSDATFNVKQFVGESMQKNLVPTLPDLAQMLSVTINATKEDQNYDDGIKETKQTKTRDVVIKDTTQRNKQLLESIAGDENYFNNIYKNEDFKSGYNVLVSKYGDILPDELKEVTDLPWIYGSEQAYGEDANGNRVLTEEAKKQQEAARLMLLEFVGDSGNGLIQPGDGSRIVIETKSKYVAPEKDTPPKQTQKQQTQSAMAAMIDRDVDYEDMSTVTNFLNTKSEVTDKGDKYVTKDQLMIQYGSTLPSGLYNVYKDQLEKVKGHRDDQVYRVIDGDIQNAFANKIFSKNATSNADMKSELMEELGEYVFEQEMTAEDYLSED